MLNEQNSVEDPAEVNIISKDNLSLDFARDLVCIFIPQEVPVISEKCFCSHTHLLRVTFSQHSRLSRIEKEAFKECQLREIEIPASVKVLGEKCFFGCSNLFRITFARGSCLEEIEELCFSRCTNLKEIEIPASVEIIGTEVTERAIKTGFREKLYPGAFSECQSLLRVTFPRDSRLKELGSYTFFGCEKLREIEIPASVEVIGKKCFGGHWAGNFHGCNSLCGVKFASGSCLKKLGVSAFKECTAIPEIEIPASVETIARRCFNACVSLTRVKFPSDSRLNVIEPGAFKRCYRISEIEIPGTVMDIGYKAFWECNIQKFSFYPESRVFTVVDNMLIDRESMAIIGTYRIENTVAIPAYIEILRMGSFKDAFGRRCGTPCGFLNNVTIPRDSRLKRMEAFSFYIARLSDMYIPAGVEVIGEWCFAYSHLKNITFAKDSVLRRIEKSAFMRTDFKSIEIPVSVEVIEDTCFNECGNLRSVIFPCESALKSLGCRAFAKCESLGMIQIPAGIEVIRMECFVLCKSLCGIQFAPNSSLRRIESRAFADTDVRTYTIPAGVEVAPDAFFKRERSPYRYIDRYKY